MTNTITTIYGGDPFYTGGQSVIDDLKSSGFTTVVAWTLHIDDQNGDLIFNDKRLVSQGAYVGDAGWPALFNSLKTGATAITRIGFCVGSSIAGGNDFQTIQNLIKDGTGPTNILRRNFSALKQTLPVLDFIDMDDETNYDHDSLVAFSQMLYQDLDLHVTFCPYTEQAFWIGCLSALNTQTPGLVQGFNLQCYAGGSINQPAQWVEQIQQAMGTGTDAAALVWPGLDSSTGEGAGNTPDAMQSRFHGWKASPGISGGFVWLYDHIQNDLPGTGYTTASYAQALTQGLS